MKMLVVVLVVMFCATIFAQQKEEKVVLAPQVVTASKTEEGSDEVSSFVTVVDETEPRMWQSFKLSELFALTPGVWVTESGGYGYFSFIFIRGTKPYHTVVLVDGMKVNSVTLGSQFDLADMDPYMIEKVEVLRGAASALYGSDAIGGVLLIETKTGHKKPKTFFFTEAGRYDTYGVRAGVSGAEGMASFSTQVSTLHSHNAFRRYSFNRNSFASALKLTLKDDSQLKLTLRFSERENEFPFDYDFLTSQLLNDENITQSHTTLVGGAEFQKRLGDKFHPEISVRTSFCLNSSVFTNGGDIDPAQPELEAINDALALSAEPRLSILLGKEKRRDGFSVRFTVGAEWQKITMENFTRYWNDWTSALESSRTTETVSVRAGYLQSILGYKEFRLSAGIRHDDYSIYGSDTSPRIGFLCDVIKKRLIFKTNYGEGFRAPTPAEMFDPWVGNPDLEAEHSRSFDVGFVFYPMERTRIEAAYFNNLITDMIAYNPATWTMENFEEAKIEGIEFGWKWNPLKDLVLSLSFTAQRPRDAETKQDLPFVSPVFGSLSASYKMKKNIEVGMVALASEAAPEENWLNTRGQERTDPGKKRVVNLFLRWQVSEWARFMFRVDNLLNDRYIDREMLPRSNGRSIILGLQMRF